MNQALSSSPKPSNGAGSAQPGPSAAARATEQAGALGNIKHVVVLMFENRSFDHILGAMPGVNGLLDAQGNCKPDIYNTMNPLAAPGATNPATLPTAIVPNSNPTPLLPVETDYVRHDFTHDFGDGMLQDLFGPGTTSLIGGQPHNNPATTYPPTNSGFLSTPAYNVGKQPDGSYLPNGQGALTYFEWGSMKVFHQLAKSFVVCDAWHCDMPGHTSTNRAFMHCGTTGDLGINDDDAHGGVHMVNKKTIFEQIQDQQATWKMYGLASFDTNYLNEKVLTQQYDAQQPTKPNVTNVPLSQFFADLNGGTLPFYSFIMCWNDTAPSTSMHPAGQVDAGENMLACVYNAFRKSNYWQDTLLVVNFDENGGIYDHESVPQVVAPDPGNPNPPVSEWPSPYNKQTYSFDFTALGIRIPVLLISPWLGAGVYSTQLQNTSVLRFLQDSLPGADPGNPFYLTQRDLHAPSIAPVFDSFGQAQLRTDCPVNMQGYANLIDCSVFEDSAANQDEAALAAAPSAHIQQITCEYVAPLPGHPDSGKPITRSFATVSEMRAYAHERLTAALAYLHSRNAPAAPPAGTGQPDGGY